VRFLLQASVIKPKASIPAAAGSGTGVPIGTAMSRVMNAPGPPAGPIAPTSVVAPVARSTVNSQLGGTNNKGTVFKIAPDGTFTTLVDFTGESGAAPGSGPAGPLVSDGAGIFLGLPAVAARREKARSSA